MHEPAPRITATGNSFPEPSVRKCPVTGLQHPDSAQAPTKTAKCRGLGAVGCRWWASRDQKNHRAEPSLKGLPVSQTHANLKSLSAGVVCYVA